MLLNKRDPQGQVACWLDQLASFELRIEYRPGKKHDNADGLSRKPCRQSGRTDEDVDDEPEIRECKAVQQQPELKKKYTNIPIRE